MSPRREIQCVRQMGDTSCHMLFLRQAYVSSVITAPLGFSSTSNYAHNFKFHHSHSKKLDLAETLDFGLK